MMESSDREYSNGEITVYWRPAKCIHATTCYKELIEVFNPRKRPWVNINGAPTDRIVEVINKCPTDALTYKWNDEEKNQNSLNLKNEKVKQALELSKKPEPKPVTIQVMRDGPLVVQGSFKLFNSNGEQMRTMAMISLCRCGGSNNMPFCDGYHRKIGFSSDV
jgi:uncharacterized Fe-S cluster protein YjdI